MITRLCRVERCVIITEMSTVVGLEWDELNKLLLEFDSSLMGSPRYLLFFGLVRTKPWPSYSERSVTGLLNSLTLDRMRSTARHHLHKRAAHTQRCVSTIFTPLVQ